MRIRIEDSPRAVQSVNRHTEYAWRVQVGSVVFGFPEGDGVDLEKSARDGVPLEIVLTGRGPLLSEKVENPPLVMARIRACLPEDRYSTAEISGFVRFVDQENKLLSPDHSRGKITSSSTGLEVGKRIDVYPGTVGVYTADILCKDGRTVDPPGKVVLMFRPLTVLVEKHPDLNDAALLFAVAHLSDLQVFSSEYKELS